MTTLLSHYWTFVLPAIVFFAVLWGALRAMNRMDRKRMERAPWRVPKNARE